METYNKVGWIVAILIFAFAMGGYLSGGSLEYDKVEIVPAVKAIYEFVPLTPAQAFGVLLSAVATSATAAFVLGAFSRLMIKDAS